MAPRFGSKKAGSGPGSLGGKVKTPGENKGNPFADKGKPGIKSAGPGKSPFGAQKKPGKAPAAKTNLMPPGFKCGGQVKKGR